MVPYDDDELPRHLSNEVAAAPKAARKAPPAAAASTAASASAASYVDQPKSLYEELLRHHQDEEDEREYYDEKRGDAAGGFDDLGDFDSKLPAAQNNPDSAVHESPREVASAPPPKKSEGVFRKPIPRDYLTKKYTDPNTPTTKAPPRPVKSDSYAGGGREVSAARGRRAPPSLDQLDGGEADSLFANHRNRGAALSETETVGGISGILHGDSALMDDLELARRLQEELNEGAGLGARGDTLAGVDIAEDERLARELHEQFHASESALGAANSEHADDEAIAWKIYEEESNHVHSVKEDEELAQYLQETEESPQDLLNDAEVARQLQQDANPDQFLDDDADLARHLQEQEDEEAARNSSRGLDTTPNSGIDESSVEYDRQKRILEDIRVEQERQQLEWAVRETGGSLDEILGVSNNRNLGIGVSSRSSSASSRHLRTSQAGPSTSLRNSSSMRNSHSVRSSSRAIPDPARMSMIVANAQSPANDREAQRRRIVERGQQETAMAIQAGNSRVVTCRGCEGRLQAPASYSFVFCPSCAYVTPTQDTAN